MTATLNTTIIQNASSSTPNITLDTVGNAAFGGMPYGASSFKRNRIINGNMGIWQRGTSLAVPLSSSGNYIVDRFAVNNSVSTAAATISQSTDVPLGVAQYSVLLTVTATQSTVNSGNFYGFWQGIEGYNIADLAYGTSSAKTLTLSFWVKSSVTGTFVANMYQTNSTNPRVFPYTYTISAANTWTYVTVTISGDTVSNALPVTNAAALELYWYTMLSSSYANGTLNTWNANTSSNQYGGSSTGVNLFATSGATWQITGVQLEVGSVATPYEFNPYNDQLAQCQRYCYRPVGTDGHNWLSAAGGWSNTTSALIGGTFPVQMRATPSLTTDSATLSNYAVYATSGATFNAVTSLSVNAVTGTFNYLLNVGTGSGGTTGTVCYLSQNNQTTYGLYWSAEL